MFCQPKNFFYKSFSYPHLLVLGSGLITPDPRLAGGYRGTDAVLQGSILAGQSLALPGQGAGTSEQVISRKDNSINSTEIPFLAIKINHLWQTIFLSMNPLFCFSLVITKPSWPPSNIALIRKANNKMKATDAIGDDMGIKGESQDLDMELGQQSDIVTVVFGG